MNENMNDKKGLSRQELEAYWADHSHRFHAAGRPPTSEWHEYFSTRPQQRVEQVYNRLWACGLMDMAWLVMLFEQKLVDQETVAKLEPMQTGLLNYHNEPIQDVLPVYMSEEYVITALAQLEGALGMLRIILPHIHPNRDRMWELLREGYSGAPDLAIVLIREKGYGGRAAHRVCATMVRIARERGISPCECSADLLQEAARISNDRIPDITDEEVKDCMGLEQFFEKHNNLGDPNPNETLRLIEQRRQAHEDARSRQAERRNRIENAVTAMKQRLKSIADGTTE